MKNLPLALRQQLNSNTLAISLKTATVLAATIIIFYQDLTIIAKDALQVEFMSHILVIPFLFSYLIYRKRKMIRASISFEPLRTNRKTFPYKTVAGTLLFLIAFLMYSYGSYTFTPLEYHIFALPIFVAGCTLILFNTQTLKQLAFPILFLFFLLPPPTEIIYTLGATLSIISTEASCAILNLFGFATEISSTYGTPTIIITQPSGTSLFFTVDIACSGIYSLIGFLIFATFIAYIARTKTWKKSAVFLTGLPLIYILNILRITIIVLLGYYHSMELAMNVFHLLGGWTLIFLGTLLLLIITEKTMKIQLFTKKENLSCPECTSLAKNKKNFCSSCGRLLKYASLKLEKLDLSKITALVIGVSIMISIQVPIFILTKGPADMLTQLEAGQQPTIEILPQIDNYTLEFIYRDKDFEQIAKEDAALMYAYFPTNSSQNIVWVAVEIASAKGLLHPWEFCIMELWRKQEGWQTGYTQLDLRDVQLIENPPLIGRQFAFLHKRNNVTQVVLYWYETSTFTTNTTTQQKHIKISLIAYPHETESIQQTEEELLLLGKAVANHRQPMKTWTEIALLISKNGSYLLLIPITLLIIIILFQIFHQVKTKQANFKVYQKLSKENKAIIEATHKTKTIPTVSNIATTYKKLNHKPITTAKLSEKLQQAQKAGLVKKRIANHQDEPILVYKT